MEYANRVLENLNKVVMSMSKAKPVMVEVERLGMTLEMTTEGYQEYLSWTEEQKDSLFKDVITASNEPSKPIPVTYVYDGLDFDSIEELLEWKARAGSNTTSVQ